MRLLVVAVALLMLVPLPVASQEPGAGVVTDGKGDVRTEAQGTPGPGPADVYSGVDLVGLAIAETKSEITFTLQVADLKPAAQDTADGIHFQVLFQHNGRHFRLDLQTALRQLEERGWFTTLEMRDSPEAEWTYAWGSAEDGRSDPATDLVSLTLPRDLLADKDGSAPFPGRALEGIQVHASGYFSDVQLFGGIVPDVRSPLKVLDDMPDKGQADGRYPIIVGPAQTGHALLVSPVPFRASNGEATTFLLNATAHNRGDRDDTFDFAAVGAPARLGITVPVTVATIPAGGSIDVPVLVTVPFAHIHGGVDDFLLEMRSKSDPNSVGRLTMGIRYLTVPQPAGHHDSLYIHSFSFDGVFDTSIPARGFGYMNTLEDDPADSGVPVHPSGLSIEVPGFVHSWYVPLEPGLEMGLDLDLARLGTFTIPISSPLLLQSQATVTVELVYGRSAGFLDDGVVIAHAEPIGPVDILPQSTHLFEGDLIADPAGDRLPYVLGKNLELVVRLGTLTPTIVGDEQPAIAPGAHLRLPLLEYHDPVDDALRALDGPGLSPLGAQERLVNPGEAVVFPFSLANPADEERAYHVELSGANMEWGSLPSNHITVPAHGTASGSLVVRAPAGAGDGDRADLIVQAYSTADPAARGLLRLLAEVDTGADHPDDTAVAADLEKKDSPAPAAWLLAVALAALALAQRRRGH